MGGQPTTLCVPNPLKTFGENLGMASSNIIRSPTLA